MKAFADLQECHGRRIRTAVWQVLTLRGPPIYYARLPLRGNAYSALAQLVEQLTVNHWVAGSSPAGGAKYIKPRTAWFFYFRRSAGREEPSWVRLRFRRAPLDANRTPETYQSRAGGAKYIKPRTAWFFYFRRSAGREEPSWVRLGFRRAPLDANRTPETYQSRAGGAKYIKPRTAWFFLFSA